MRSGLIHTLVVVSVCSGAGYGFYYLDQKVVGPDEPVRQPIRSAAVEGAVAADASHKVVVGAAAPAAPAPAAPVWRNESTLVVNRGERVVGEPGAPPPLSPAQLATKASRTVFTQSADAKAPSKYIPRSYSTTTAPRKSTSGARTSLPSYGRYSLNNLPARAGGSSRSAAVAGSSPFSTSLSKQFFKKPRFPFSFTKKRTRSYRR
jgi:hypothetical protein